MWSFPVGVRPGLGLAERPPQVWENRVISCVLASIFGTSWGLLGGPVHKGNLVPPSFLIFFWALMQHILFLFNACAKVGCGK